MVVRFSLAVCFLILALGVHAQQVAPDAAENLSAHQVVSSATERVMAAVSEAADYVDEDPQRYYDRVQSILDPVIDFRGFARGVMGSYASSERYRSLDDDGREQLRAQLDQFSEVMRIGLVKTYSKGLLAFGGSRIEITEPTPGEDVSSRAAVQQLIYSDNATPYVVMYQMGRGKSGQWKLRNMIIESVNLGEIYKNQFQSAARKHDGDLDIVIANWSTVTE